ncbi:chromosome segregation SMC family protein [Amaricoccus solimangrovi]|uniref:Chromosome partition protein Smc n=1 Tax=Amaricoccus solimangrovi TaxID=2589815 RepID=A0A501WG48_9RHOB|nr:AAA family ATPase [Amaricoccus solimangrovi]TPE48853.1 chromosome segregation protein SMC [Amaricoccus solimangrovi]
MHFTRLRLLGFKSFVDPTELTIAPGLTGVIGPNGCGKSNLLEALRWVMGETRASVMRGDGMEDVIFAGSGKRPARNHAEVTLTLDNRDRTAPAGFNEADTLEVVRRITRDAGSAYRANGKEARARDVQMLFADASTGAQSPSLVRQGQISELINAKPRARRRVLEEAAGISGLYQRRHEAELKLRATETNLARVGDVLEALETQLAQLSRQARQAARYREIAEALRRAEAMLLCRLWRDAEEERMATTIALTDTTRAAAAAEARAAETARARAAAEEGLPALREEDAIAAAVAQRIVLERDRHEAEVRAAAEAIRALEGQIRQLAQDRDREAALDADAGTMMERLAAETAELMAEEEAHGPRLAGARDAAAQAGGALGVAEAAFAARAETAARLTAAHEAATRAAAEASRRAEELERGLAEAEQARDAAEAEQARAATDREAAEETAALTEARAAEAEDALAEAEARAAERRRIEAEARAARSEAEGAARALASEAASLRKLIERSAPARQGIVDLVEVAPGFEAAFGAALGADLSLPPVAGTEASGWLDLPPCEAPEPLPPGAEPLAPRVAGPAELGRRLAAVGIAPRAAGDALQPLLRPGQRLVSLEGDLWRWDGLRVAAGAAPSAAAERLRQRNRLTELEAQEAAAEERAEAARAVGEDAASAFAAATAAETAARATRKAAEAAAAEAERALGRAGTAAEAIETRLATLSAASTRRAAEGAEARAAAGEAAAALATLADPAAARAEVEAERLRVEAARLTMLTRRAEADELERAGKARERRLAEIDRDRAGWTARRANASDRLAGLDARVEAAEEALDAARDRPAELDARGESLARGLDEAEGRRSRAAEALARAEAGLRDAETASRAAERAASEAREARAGAEARAEAARARAEAEAERLTAETGQAPADLLAGLGTDLAAVPKAAELDTEVARLRRARGGLGAVNLRAEEDARELQIEFDTLIGERTDLEEAIKKLRLGIAGLNREGRGRLLAAFDEVNRNFATLFRHLFGGGEANLVLVESDDPLEAGLEIMAQPPGKKLSTLSLLSGGEQTLTALSLIFAVFLANPSPICVLDEVDAPLDDANVTRFCDLLDEMIERTETRFLVITHHAVTMGRMDRLFGVTMQEQGVSQLVSVDLAAAERLVESVG